MEPEKPENPFSKQPKHPNRKRRSKSHDYCRPARYMVTIRKDALIPAFSNVVGKSKIMEGSEAPQIQLLPGREYIEEAIALWKEKLTQITIAEQAIMPDHIHLCLDVWSYLKIGLSRAMSQLMGKISRCRHDRLPENVRPAEVQSVFEKGFNDSIARDQRQWESQKAYVRDNPRRYLLKKENPDYLLAKWMIAFGEYSYTAKGNIFLLRKPHLFQTKHHRAWSEEESENYQQHCRVMIDNGSVPVSPYIHQKEKAIRDYAIDNGDSYIRICENGFAEKETAWGREVDLMAEGRLLLIAPMEHSNRKIDMDWKRAHKMNDVAAQLAEACNGGALGSIRRIW